MTRRGDILGRIVGFLVFLLGIAIILVVLRLGFTLFQDPTLSQGSAASTKPSVESLASGFGALLIRIALLFLGSISGSLIANKGINLYFASLPGAAQKGSPEDPPRSG